jgi:hypothetical protein
MVIFLASALILIFHNIL